MERFGKRSIYRRYYLAPIAMQQAFPLAQSLRNFAMRRTWREIDSGLVLFGATLSVFG
jgi:hypothetical protein